MEASKEEKAIMNECIENIQRSIDAIKREIEKNSINQPYIFNNAEKIETMALYSIHLF